MNRYNAIDLSLDTNIFINSKLNAALQELDILFNTTNTELIGYPTFGTDFESFLWQMTPSPKTLKRYIREKIDESTIFCKEFEISVEVEVVEGEFRSIYNVIIALRTSPEDNTIAGYRIYQLR